MKKVIALRKILATMKFSLHNSLSWKETQHIRTLAIY